MTSGNAFVNASPVAAPAAAGNDHEHDVEAGGVAGLAPQEVEFVDPFDIANTKNASIESLKRWRVRFPYNAASNVYPSFVVSCLYKD